MIAPLQSLRGVFALLIFLHHFMWEGHSLSIPAGDCGVSFFFTLSGFVICLDFNGRMERDEAISPREFMLRRVARLYPLHLLCLAAFIAIFGLQGLGSLAASLALVQSWVPRPDYYFGYNAVAWCLCDFMLLYALAPWLFSIVRHGGRPCLALAAAIFLPYFVIAAAVPRAWVDAFVYIEPLMRVPDFLLGMLAWSFLFRPIISRRAIIQASWRRAAEVGVVALGALLFATYSRIDYRWGCDSFWWLLSVSAVLIFALPAPPRCSLARALSWKPLVVFGDASFSFYMLHYIVIRIAERYAASTPAVAFVVALSATTVLALAVARYFEIPTYRYLKSIINSWQKK